MVVVRSHADLESLVERDDRTALTALLSSADGAVLTARLRALVGIDADHFLGLLELVDVDQLLGRLAILAVHRDVHVRYWSVEVIVRVVEASLDTRAEQFDDMVSTAVERLEDDDEWVRFASTKLLYDIAQRGWVDLSWITVHHTAPHRVGEPATADVELGDDGCDGAPDGAPDGDRGAARDAGARERSFSIPPATLSRLLADPNPHVRSRCAQTITLLLAEAHEELNAWLLALLRAAVHGPTAAGTIDRGKMVSAPSSIEVLDVYRRVAGQNPDEVPVVALATLLEDAEASIRVAVLDVLVAVVDHALDTTLAAFDTVLEHIESVMDEDAMGVRLEEGGDARGTAAEDMVLSRIAHLFERLAERRPALLPVRAIEPFLFRADSHDQYWAAQTLARIASVRAVEELPMGTIYALAKEDSASVRYWAYLTLGEVVHRRPECFERGMVWPLLDEPNSELQPLVGALIAELMDHTRSQRDDFILLIQGLEEQLGPAGFERGATTTTTTAPAIIAEALERYWTERAGEGGTNDGAERAVEVSASEADETVERTMSAIRLSLETAAAVEHVHGITRALAAYARERPNGIATETLEARALDAEAPIAVRYVAFRMLAALSRYPRSRLKTALRALAEELERDESPVPLSFLTTLNSAERAVYCYLSKREINPGIAMVVCFCGRTYFLGRAKHVRRCPYCSIPWAPG